MLNIWAAVFRLLLLVASLAISANSLAGGGAVATKSILTFKAGNYTKSGASISSLAVKDLRYATKSENVAGLLDLAQNESRLDTIKAIELSGPFSSMWRGDELLLKCLKKAQCKPETVYSIAKNSDTHAEVLARNPNLGPTQVNHAVGEINERLMLRFYENSGWKAVDGQVGRTGFDGLFVKYDDAGSIRDLLIVESKFNTSTLKSTNHGRQMSDEWVRKKIQDLLIKSPESQTYQEIERMIDQRAYRARLWNLKADNGKASIELKSIHNKDDSVALLNVADAEGLPRVIDFQAPRNDFERRFANWYFEELDRTVPSAPIQ